MYLHLILLCMLSLLSYVLIFVKYISLLDVKLNHVRAVAGGSSIRNMAQNSDPAATGTILVYTVHRRQCLYYSST